MDSATFVPYSSLPRADYYSVALCQIGIDDIARRNKARASRRNVKQEGGAYRAMAVALPGGRYAQLVTYDARPDTVEILIQTFQTRFAFRCDLDAVADLIGVSVKDFSWVVSDDVIRFR